jgi:hypothetical protein
MAHGQWTEIEARGVLDAWKKSGKPIWSYAKSRGLVPQRLYEEVVAYIAHRDQPSRASGSRSRSRDRSGATRAVEAQLSFLVLTFRREWPFRSSL